MMDTSKEYIKMCEKAKEIQKTWKPRVGDLVWRGSGYLPIKDACGYITNVDIFDNQGYKVRGNIWLPRQDQLQDMIKKFKKDKNIDLYWMMKALHDFQVIYTAGLGITSMEQLWLAFVMKEKYSKQWNGKDWIKI